MAEAGDAESERLAADLGTVAGVSDRGYAHAHNEDAMAMGHGAGATVAAVVCDGVSTSFAPERAARAAADAALDVLLTRSEPPEDRVRAAVEKATAHVTELEPGPEGRTSSCTLVCGLVRWTAAEPEAPVEITVAWVGDSRAYWLAPDGRARQLTADHSWASEMVAAGVLDEETAMSDARSHAITRWIGAGENPQPGVTTLRPAESGILLLCSDGLWNYLPDADDLSEITFAALADGGPLAAAHQLTELALAAGGRDNITIVLIPV